MRRTGISIDEHPRVLESLLDEVIQQVQPVSVTFSVDDGRSAAEHFQH